LRHTTQWSIHTTKRTVEQKIVGWSRTFLPLPDTTSGDTPSCHAH
jgi:hypothetical protein